MCARLGPEMTSVLGRRLLLAGSACAPFAAPALTRAQMILPSKPARMIVGSAASGGADKMARAITPRLETRVGVHVAVENKPSITGSNGCEALVKGPKDGSVLAFAGSEVLAGKFVTPDFPFDPLKDITPVTLAGGSQTGLAISSSTGIANFADYLAWMKDGSAERRRIGTTACPAYTELFCRTIEGVIGGKLERVGYRGAAPMVNDLSIGRIPACLSAATSLIEHHRGPRLKIVLSSGRERSRLTPNIPTAAELGYPMLQVFEWVGIFVSSAVPAPVIEEWNRHLVAVIADGEVKAELIQLGLEVSPTSVEDAVKLRDAYLEDWKKRLDGAGFKLPG